MAKRKRVTAHALAKHLQDELNESHYRLQKIAQIISVIPEQKRMPHEVDIYNLAMNEKKGVNANV